MNKTLLSLRHIGLTFAIKRCLIPLLLVQNALIILSWMRDTLFQKSTSQIRSIEDIRQCYGYPFSNEAVFVGFHMEHGQIVPIY